MCIRDRTRRWPAWWECSVPPTRITAYLFANRRANRMKVLVHDGIGIGIWLAARRLHQGHFVWPQESAANRVSLSRAQLDALVLGLPWSRIGSSGIISVV